ncbi:protein disulfide oxidoreductase [Nitratifractor sp.]
MKKAIRIIKEILLLLVTVSLLSTLFDYIRAPKLHDTRLPRLSGHTLQGESLKTFLGKSGPLLIQFWGTWCPVCRQEIDNIERVARHYPVLTIAVESGSDAEIRQWMKDKGVDFPVLSDPSGRLAKRFDVGVYPTSFIYDSRGTLKFTVTGYTTTLGLLARLKLAE